MRILKCDKCRVVINKNPKKEKGISFSVWDRENLIHARNFDLCPRCGKKLVAYVNKYLSKSKIKK
jgi:hypothetical protein